MRNILRIIFVLIIVIGCVLSSPHTAAAVSGTLTDDPTIWGSDQIVTGNVIVPNGVRLWIYSGVTVRFKQGTSLIINSGGSLQTFATSPSNMITFTAYDTTTEAGYWNRIYFQNQTGASSLKWCIIENSTAGASLYYSPIRIANCTFRRNTNGIVLKFSNSVTIEGCTIASNESGIYFDDYSLNASIEGNNISRNVNGIYVRKGSSADVRGNDIVSNEVGVFADGSVCNVISNEVLFNNTGIKLLSSTSNISNNVISLEATNYRASTGIYLANGSVLIDRNTIINNNTAPISLSPPTASIFNDQSLYVTLEVSNNNISSPIYRYGVWTSAGGTVDLKIHDNVLINSNMALNSIGAAVATVFAANSVIERNVIIGNMAPSSIGLNMFWGSCLARLNTITGWYTGAQTYQGGQGLQFNNLAGNTYGAVKSASHTANNYWEARQNWWGASNGPGAVGSGNGSMVGSLVLYDPWLTAPISLVSAGAVSAIRLFSDADYSTEISHGSAGILDRVFISVAASDPSPEALNWTSVRVTTGADPTGITLVLTETSSNSGVYNGYVRLDGLASSIEKNLIKAAVNNTLTISSTLNPSINNYLTVANRAKWLKENSPEIAPLNTTWTLPSTSTLEIEPGVTVEAFGVGVSQSLSIYGKIIASGEGDSRIWFTSGFLNPALGDWSSILVFGEGQFNDCDIEYSNQGIRNYGGRISVSNSRFFGNGWGVGNLQGATSNVVNSYFEGNRYGIYSEGWYLTVLGNTFYNNGTSGTQGGIYCYSTSASIKGNTFSSNKPQGIYASSGNGLVPDISFNNFLNNADYGIFNYTQSAPFSALYNWWGTSEGADLTDNRITPPAPGGATPGDNISAFIYYEPYLTQGPVGYSTPSSITSLSVSGGRGILERMFVDVLGTDSSAESVNWTTVNVSSESYPAGITLDLVETGLNTGAFEGVVRVVANPSNVNLSLISAEVSKIVTVSSVQDPSFYAARTIGSIGTWEAANNPEILERSTIFNLPSSSTLYVQPGVTVEFDDGSGLNVSGTFIASGEAANRITFTSRRTYPVPGNWQYIKLSGAGGNSSVIANCDVSYGTSDIWLSGCSPVFNNNNIRSASGQGIYCDASAVPLIQNSVIENNTGHGIYVSGGKPKIVFNTIRANGASGKAGVYLSVCSPATVEGNVISSNESYGIYSANSTHVLIRGNTIEAGPNSTVRYCIYGKNIDPLVRFNNLVGNDSDDYGVYMEQIIGSPTPAIDASHNYWSNAKVGNYVISTPSVEGTLAYSPPSAINAIRLFKDKNYTVSASGLGILDRIFISAEATDSDSSNYNWATVVMSNESSPLSKVSVDLVETADNSGIYNGEARIGSANDGWVGMVGSAVGNTLRAYSQDGSVLSGPLTVLSVATWEAVNSPERILNYSNLLLPNLPAVSTLNIEPGVRVEAGNNVLMEFRGTLRARGEKGNNILFTSANPNPSPGSWQGMLFNSGIGCLLAYSKIEYAVYGTWIDNDYASPATLAMVSVESCSFAGIVLSSVAKPKIVDCDILNNTAGVTVEYTTFSGTPRINYNNIINSSHSRYGVYNIPAASTTLDATNNWWDAVSGPGPIASGSGVKVSSKVSYLPYLTSPEVAGGPVASAPSPADGQAIKNPSPTLIAKLFDPEDVDLSTIVVNITGETVSWGDSRLTYEASTNNLKFMPSSPFSEGATTFEIVSAQDTFGETLRQTLEATFIVDLTSPEITGVQVSPYYAKAGNVHITVEATDALSGIDYSVLPAVGAATAGGDFFTAQETTYEAGAWQGILMVLGTFENGLATVEAEGIYDRAGNVCMASLEAAQVFIDTVAPSVELTSPTGSITIEGPGTYAISWEGVSDPPPASGIAANPISLYLVLNGVEHLITGEIADSGTYVWNVPPITSSNCRIRVKAKDNAQNVGVDTGGVFSISTVNPVIVSTDPYDGQVNLPTSETVTVVFSKPMSTEVVESAFTVKYTAGTFEWTDGDTIMIFRPDSPLNSSTTYEVEIKAGPVDKANHILLNTPYKFTFSTVSPAPSKPIISRVKFDGRPYLANDVISSTPKIDAVIIDSPEGTSAGIAQNDITVRLSSYVAHPDTYTSSGEMRVKITKYPLGQGNYVVTIEAVDRAGYWADPFTAKVRVIYGDVQVVGPLLIYPVPFKPLSGEKATISYTLSKDANIALYMYDISGRQVLTRKFGAGTMGGRTGYNAVEWNGVSDFKGVVGNGIYVYRILSGKRVLGTGKIVVYD